MSNTLAFPMYAVNRADNEALWQAVQSLLLARGVSAGPSSETDLLAHWQEPDVILSQTCGYPLVTLLPDVQVVGCFHYAAPGCDGIHYRSFLVAREEDKHRTLADFRGRRAVCNSLDSQSGYNVLRKMVTPLAVNGRFFAHAHVSGSHRQSLIDVRRGVGDIAAIDCVTHALLLRHEPQLLDGLAVIDRSPLAPGLPLITSPGTTPATLRALREALNALVTAPEYRAVRAATLIGGFSEASRQTYSLLLDWRDEAERSGLLGL